MNNQLLQEFAQRLRNQTEELNTELLIQNMDVVKVFDLIKILRRDLTHINNLVKMNVDVKKKDV